MIRTVVPVEEEGALGALLEELAGDVITKIGFREEEGRGRIPERTCNRRGRHPVVDHEPGLAEENRRVLTKVRATVSGTVQWL